MSIYQFGRTPLKIDIETKMFKHFERFPFIETNRHLFKAFKKEKFDTKGWVQNLKSSLDMPGLGNLQQNIYTVDARYLEHLLSRTFTIWNFLAGPLNFSSNSRLKNIRYLELRHLKLSLSRTNYLIP